MIATNGKDAAARMSNDAGLGATSSASAATYSANKPCSPLTPPVIPYIPSPISNPNTPCPDLDDDPGQVDVQHPRHPNLRTRGSSVGDIEV